MGRKTLIAGNWKMNGLRADIPEIIAIAERADDFAPLAELLICPPASLLVEAASRTAPAPLAMGGQHCHAKETGAHTGEISAEMLRDAGAEYVILGHSERRAAGEDDESVRACLDAAERAGLRAIVCVGESLEIRDAGDAEEFITRQISASLAGHSEAAPALDIAYEPVWAIGTGKTALASDIAAMHTAIRHHLEHHFGASVAARTRLLYGGSVKPGNAGEILSMENVDGVLVGGASLKAADFIGIASAARSH
jgi:triosephosphate isomerase